MLSKKLSYLIVLVALTPVAYAVPDDGAGNRAAPPAPVQRPADPTQARKTFTLGFEEYQMATGLENASAGFTGEQALRAKGRCQGRLGQGP